MASEQIRCDVCLPLRVGQTFSRTLRFDSKGIRDYAALVGDANPLHNDESFARRSQFGGLIACGAHSSGVLAAMVASVLSSLRPSLGLDISFQFRRAVRADETLTARWTLDSIARDEKLGGDIVVFVGALSYTSGEAAVIGRVVSLVR